MQVTIHGSRLSPFVEKVIRGAARKGLTRQLIEPKSSSDFAGEWLFDSTFILRWRGAARILLGAIALLIAVDGARADEGFFRRCEVERRAALVNADAAALGRLMLDGAQYVHSNGEIDDKPSLMRRISNGELRYRSIVADEERYACAASGCEVTGAQTLGVTAGGREVRVHNQFRVTWLRSGDSCRLVAYQSSPLAAPTSASDSKPRS